ncbi:hypothetical protein [Streptomyces alboflavus]|uniref:hypothetical protein n=1 Tax=Streptomyces alboflavus TaxID=67267 RepID=UPI0036B11555
MIRKSITAMATAGVLAAGGILLTTAPAQAAEPQAGSAAISPAPAATTGASDDLGTATWQWVYAGQYPNRSQCDAAANRLRDYYQIRGQCRGPYTGGVFHLYIWVNR